MNSRQINSKVHCLNAFGDVPEFARGDINDDFKLRLRALARATRDLHVDRIAALDYTMKWYASEGCLKEFHVEVPMLIVQADIFWWEAIPEGCGPGMMLRTEPQPISWLYEG